jgi:DNA polymerase-3 subunit delta
VQLKPEQLAQQLASGLAPAYLVSGDEPLQLWEAADAIRQASREAGFDERHVLEADTGFDWQALARAADSPSLFASRRLLELRLSKSHLGETGGRALRAYLERPPPDAVLLAVAPKLERDVLRSGWFKALDALGVIVRVWVPDQHGLPRWIAHRLRAKGLRVGSDACALIAARIEGNLLAAAQEIDKLVLLHGPGPLGVEAVAAAVTDSARYDVFALVDAALAGDTARAVHVLDGLRAEGEKPPMLLWALADGVRKLNTVAQRTDAGDPASRVLAEQRVFERRKALMRTALERARPQVWRHLLQRCAGVDRVIKGVEVGTPWDALAALTVDLAQACRGHEPRFGP